MRVEGVTVAVDERDADVYFATRPRGSQLGAWASPQCRVIAGREVLVQKRRSPDLAALPASFGGRRPPLAYVLVNVVAFIGFIALGWAAFPSVFWVGLLMSAIFAVAVYYEMRDIVFETELAGSGLILRTFFGERTIERSRIVKVALHLRRTRSYGSAWSGFRSLNVGVALNTGETVWTKPRRGNAFDLHRAIVRWLEV